MGFEWPFHGFWLFVLTLVLGAVYQRIFENKILKMGDEHGYREYDWFRTCLMSLWIALPLGAATLFLIF